MELFSNFLKNPSLSLLPRANSVLYHERLDRTILESDALVLASYLIIVKP